LTEVYGIRTIGYGGHLVAFVLEKDDVSLEQLYLIVNP
jgi:hypothetical protein